MILGQSEREFRSPFARHTQIVRPKESMIDPVSRIDKLLLRGVD